jgi:PadR family transcriptional regulator, regulatory protein PadR
MPIQIRQGTLDLMTLRTLATIGPQHAYGIANRLQQVSEDGLNLNQGTIYPALVLSSTAGLVAPGARRKTVAKKYYTITRAGLKALNEETKRWRQMAGVVEKLLAEEQ